MTRQLETTESMALQALHSETLEGMGLWICKDACAAHELLALVRTMAEQLAYEVIQSADPSNASYDALDAAAPWLDN